MDFEPYGLVRDALVGSHHAVCLGGNFLADEGKVKKALAGEVEKFAPLLLGAGVVRSWQLHQLQQQGAAGDDVGATWQEITSHERLEDGALARALAPDHRNLGEVELEVERHLMSLLVVVDGCCVVLHTWAKMSCSLLIAGIRQSPSALALGVPCASFIKHNER